MQAGQAILIFQQIQAPCSAQLKIEADAMLLAKAIDGIYDSDPKVNPGGKEV